MEPYKYHLSPEQFKFLRVLTEGSYGMVWKCQAKDINKIVAVKSPEDEYIAKNEVIHCWFWCLLDRLYRQKYSV